MKRVRSHLQICIFLLSFSMFLFSCGGSGDKKVVDPPPVPPYDKVQLLGEANNLVSDFSKSEEVLKAAKISDKNKLEELKGNLTLWKNDLNNEISNFQKGASDEKRLSEKTKEYKEKLESVRQDIAKLSK